MKIVSLLPAATEICYALDLQEKLVGVSHDCDWPPEVRKLPVLSETSIDEEASSAEIDQSVKERVHNGRSIYHVDAERMQELDPDLVLTQELCEVCAPSFDEVREAARIRSGDTKIVSLEPRCLDDILDNIRTVGHHAECSERADRLVNDLEKRIDSVRETAMTAEHTPRILCLEWLDPLFVGGHWVPEMVEISGGTPMHEPGEHSIEISWDEIQKHNPQKIILMPCGFSPERIRRELPEFTSQERWRNLKAVRKKNVCAVHGSHYFNRPGPRIVDGLEILATVIHPDLFDHLDLPENSFFHVENVRS